MSCRRVESPSFASTEDYRQMDSNSTQQTSERKSVFERLGRITRTIDTRRVVTTRHDFEETDLRYKVSRKQRKTVVSPQRSVSPQLRSQKTIIKSSTHKTEDNTKVKSLVLAPNRRSESPTTHSQSVSSSSNSSSLKRSNEQRFASNKWEDDIDDDELEKKRLQLQRELQELEISGTLDHQMEKTLCLPLTASAIRSRSSSTLSSESGSYSSSIKSLSKTSSCSSSADKKSNMKSSNREVVEKSNKSMTSDKKSLVSSSISRKSSNSEKITNSEECGHKKSSELKLDRHGNVRISLDEQERQKRLRAERFAQNKLSSIDGSKKISTHDSNSAEQRSLTSRDDSYSPPAKKARESVAKNKPMPEKHVESLDNVKVERNDDMRRDERKRKGDSRSSKCEFSPRSKSSDKTTDCHKPKHEENRNKSSERSRRSSLLSGSPNYDERHDHSRDSRFSDRDNTSVTSRRDHRKTGAYSRDQSPAHSSHSKISRDSSIGSDFSRRSKSERLSTQSNERSIVSQNIEPKNIEVKVSVALTEEMSPISADSSIPDVIDSPKIESKISVQKEDQTLTSNGFGGTQNEDESDDNFSDWSEGEDELLLKSDAFESFNETKNMAPNTQEKDIWKDLERREAKRIDSVNSYQSHTKDDALEAISDDELDAIIGETEPIDSTLDSQKSSSSRQMLDSLEIDWASLVSEPKTKMKFIPGSARKRFTPANVLMRIGFSQAFAGPLMTQKIVDFCQNELKDDFVPFRHPMAAVHSLINERIKERRYLFNVETTHSTALSGRKDLQIRKMLNKSSFKMFDNSSAANTTIPSMTTVNDSSVSSTTLRECNASDIECC